MNYLEWILAWDRWKQVNQPTASVIALWHELMAIWNRCGWQDDFTVPNGLLQIGAGLSRKEFDTARQWLIGKGRIYYLKSNRVNQAGRYRMLPFSDSIVQKGQQTGQQNNPDCSKRTTGGATQGATNGTTDGATNGEHNINKTKQNETKQNNKSLFMDFVLLTTDEHKKLIDQLGQQKTDDMISRLNSYAHQKPKKFKEYASHYHTILAWVRKDSDSKVTSIHGRKPGGKQTLSEKLKILEDMKNEIGGNN